MRTPLEARRHRLDMRILHRLERLRTETRLAMASDGEIILREAAAPAWNIRLQTDSLPACLDTRNNSHNG
jgi:hypothetical protein